ncbi:plasmid mobilization relaxosome protein MobC [uncultured Arthrobacter sp.]|uniref:plasmid mobilization relaxosome protein MobC n=1 Tax=uncultured Arthrobacter sp. TaxID=114050 RepID=UPI00260D92E0|nr:plasmid mobilization relaxosome protein MobC [uncultured Arthrobacter sp.]
MYVRVSMSELERAQLLQLESQTGLSPSAILVDAALGSGDPAVLTLRKQEVVTLLTIRRLIGTAANNVNQIARHANATGEVKNEALAAVQQARHLMRQIEAKMYELKP